MTTDPRELEPPTRFARSLLWQLQRASYQAQGPQAWRAGGVPLQVTSNPFIARGYAEVVAGFIRDLQRSARPPTRPVTVIELGAGSGRFGFYLLRALATAFERDGDPAPPFRVVMTDLAERNLAAWAEHPRLWPYVAQGLLDFARFDADQPGPLALRVSGEVLAPDPDGEPVIAIANYFFDSITHDAYRIDDGQVRGCQVALAGAGDRASAVRDPAAALDALTWRIEHGPADLDHAPPAVAALCAEYAEALAATTVLVPVAGLVTLDYLAGLGGGRLLVLTTDKGQRELALLDGQDDLSIVRHGGAISLSVNFHALARHVERAGGFALPREQRHEALYTGVLGVGVAPEALPRTLRALDDLDRFGPGDYQRLIDATVAETPRPSRTHVLGLLRLGGCDPRLVVRFAEPLTAAVKEQPPAWSDRDLTDALEGARALHYPLPGQPDELLPLVGALLYYLRQPGRALACLEEALAAAPDDVALHLRIALCWLELARPERALASVDCALARAPDHAAARQLRDWLAAGAPAGPLPKPP